MWNDDLIRNIALALETEYDHIKKKKTTALLVIEFIRESTGANY